MTSDETQKGVSQSHQIRILFVDDDPLMGEFAKVHLSGDTTSVDVVGNGLTAWTMLADGAYDIVLTDIEMPGIDGFELVRTIRRDPALENMPVIMVTGAGDTASIDRSFEVGASGFVGKPVNWHQLGYHIRYVLRASRLEADLRHARLQADAASRLKGNIMRVMRHEFRTPLNAILGFAQLLQTPTFGNDVNTRVVSYARDIEQAGNRLLTLLNDMVSASELLAGEIRPAEDDYALSRLIARALEQTAEFTGQTPEVVVEGVDPATRISCDREMFAGMLRHLLVNALTHGSGGRCHLKVAARKSGALSISVLDDGPGLPPAVLEQDAEFFLSAGNLHSQFQTGIGLGLASAVAVARIHDGRVKLANRDCGGAHVEVEIPKARVEHGRTIAAVA